MKDLLKILLKRWYVILGITALFCIVSFPISRYSYERAVQNYEKFTAEVIYEQSCTVQVKGVDSFSKKDQNVASAVCELLNNPLVKNEIITSINNSGVTDVAIQEEDYTISFLKRSDNILIKSDCLNPVSFQALIDKLKLTLKNEVSSLFDSKVVVNFGDITCQESKTTSYAKAVMKEPVAIDSYKKIVVTSSIFGLLIGICSVLFVTFEKAGKSSSKGIN